MGDLVADVKAAIRDVPDFPQPGVLFKDITPLLGDPAVFGRVIDWMAGACRELDAERIVGIEARGFLFGAPLVTKLGAGFVPVRKPGKLPYKTDFVKYTLEYGAGEIHLHADAIRPGQRVVIVDDLLATGGTASAAVDLVRRQGGIVVGAVFLIELGFLDGRARLDVPVKALIRY